MISDNTAGSVQKEYQQLWKDAFQLSLHGMAIGLANNNTILTCNSAFARSLGMAVDEVEGKPIMGMYAPESLNEVKKAIQTADKTGSVHFRSQMLRADGSRFPVMMDVVSVRDERGKVIYRIATQQDLTEIDQAERELAFNEKRLQLAITAAGMGAWEIDLITNEVIWSEEYAAILGLRPEDSPKKSEDFRKLVHPDDRDFMVRTSHEAQDMNLPYACEFRVKLPNGDFRWIYEVGHHITDESGKAVRVIGLGMDITQRKKAQEELRYAHDRMKQFVDSNVVGIVTAAADGSIVEANDYYLDLLGYSRAEYEAGQVNWRAITPPEWLPADEKALKELRETGRCEPYEKEYLRRDGSRVSVLINDALLPGPEGQIAAFVLDVTAHRQADKQVQNLTRLYATLSQVNQAILREKDEEGFFYSICKVAVDYGRFDLAWIGLYDRGTGEVKVHSAHGSRPNHRPLNTINFMKQPFKEGLVAQAAASGHVRFSNDLQQDSSSKRWGDLALAENFHSSAVVPFHCRGEIAGFLILLSTELNFFAEKDTLLLLEEMGGDISFALDGMERERLREAAEIKLRRSEADLAEAQHVAKLGSWSLVISTSEIRWSDEVFKIFDIEREAFTGKSTDFYGRVHPADVQLIRSASDKAAETGESYDVNYRVITRDGQIKYLREIGYAQLDGNGAITGLFGIVQDVSDLKEAEKALFRSQQILSLFVEHAPAAIAMFDRDMRYLAVSKRFISDYHIKDANIIGRCHYDIFPDISDEMKAVHQRGLNGAAEKKEEYQFHRSDGVLEWVNWEFQPWYEPDSTIGGIILFSEIISEKVEARLRLEESEQKFATLFNKATIPTALTKFPENTFIDVNEAWQQLFGFEKTEVVGKDAVELGINVNSAEREKTMAALRQRKPRPNHEQVLFDRSGKPITVLINTDIIAIEGEEYFLNSYNDITALKKAQSAERKSEERFRTTLDIMLEGCEIINKDWRYLYVNAAAAGHARMPKEEILGKSYLDIFPDVKKSDLYNRMRKCLENQEHDEFEQRFDYPNGARWFYISLLPIPEGLFILSIDRTQRKQAEERAASLLERLNLATDAARVGIWDWDVASDKLIWDERMFALYGFHSAGSYLTYDERLQKVHPDDRARNDEYFRMALRGEKDYDTAYRVVWPDGAVHWLKAYGQVYKDKSGKASRMVGVTIDITDQQLAQLEIQRRTDDLAVINAVNDAINTGEDISGIAQAFARETRQILKCQDVAIYILSDDGKYLEMQGMTLPRKIIDRVERIIGSPIPPIRIPVKKGSYLSFLLDQQNGFIMDDPAAIQKWIMEFTQTNYLPEIVRAPIRKAVPLIYKALHIKSTLAIPLIMNQKVMGLLDLSSDKPFNEEDLQRIRSLRVQLTSAIMRKQAEINEQTLLKHVSAMQTIDRVISSSLDMRVTLDVLTNTVISGLGVDAVSILKYDPFSQMLEFTAGKGFQSPEIRNFKVRLGEGLVGSIGLERKTRYVANLMDADIGFVRRGLPKDDPFVEYTGVPLVAKGALKGVLEVFSRIPVGRSAEWINYLEAMAGQAAIAIDNAQLFEGLQRSNMELSIAYDATIEGWSQAMDMRDKETEGHTRRVVQLTLELARRSGISDEGQLNIRRGALLHDIGKLGVPDRVLLKPDKLTEEEWALMRQHPEFAYHMLSPITYLRQAIDIPYCHHEKWDGSGYPRGLKGEQIPLAARLFAVVDVWDALISDRPYRAAWPPKKVLKHIQSLAGSHFDPNVVALFLQVIKELPEPMA